MIFCKLFNIVEVIFCQAFPTQQGNIFTSFGLHFTFKFIIIQQKSYFINIITSSLGSQRNPVLPSSTSACEPPPRAITGMHPHAVASTTTFPYDSEMEGKTKISDDA